MGISILDGIKKLQEYGIPAILDEDDKVITDNPRDYSSWQSLIGIHLTDYAPNNATIFTSKGGKKIEPEFIQLFGKIYEFSVYSTRNTIHMVVNNEVEDIDGVAYWSRSKYAVLCPFKDIPKEQIKSGNPIDSFIEGNLNLKNSSWILCPSAELKKMQESSCFFVYVFKYDYR